MDTRYLRFVLLLWFQRVLHAQSAAHSCDAPSLTGGYFDPEYSTYTHETKLTYACNNGLKPAVEGWWSTSTCQNGTWSPKPQCINNTACIPPTVPHGKYEKNENGWHEHGDKIRITCDEKYENKQWNAMAECRNGTWISMPICEKSADACGEPPRILHAVIVNQRHQELFAADTKLQYECEDGYTAEGAGNQKFIYCIKGGWSKGPACIKVTGSGTGHSGSAGSGTQPAGGVNNCKLPPLVRNGVVTETFGRSARYQCNRFYKLQGRDTVRCNSDGTWSTPPTCRATFCYVNTVEDPVLEFVGGKYLTDGQTERFKCRDQSGWLMDHFSEVFCIEGALSFSRCCNRLQLFWGTC